LDFGSQLLHFGGDGFELLNHLAALLYRVGKRLPRGLWRGGRTPMKT
jgi:hypothetical protein